MYGDTGKLLKELSTGVSAVDIKSLAILPIEGDATAGQDGLFYVLKSKTVVVLDQMGEVVRVLKFRRPEAMTSAWRIDVSRGKVSIGFNLLQPKQNSKEVIELNPRALLLDAQSGIELGDYVFNSEAGFSILCFDSSAGYTLFGFDDKDLPKVIAPLKSSSMFFPFLMENLVSSKLERLRWNVMEEFSRIQRLPPYVFNITGEMKANARKRGEDIIDFGMGNPDGATPPHIVDKMIEAARRRVDASLLAVQGNSETAQGHLRPGTSALRSDFDPDRKRS